MSLVPNIIHMCSGASVEYHKKQSGGSFFVPGSNDKQIKTVAYMDDITIIVKNAKSLKRAIGTVEWFCGGSGFKINLNKSSIFTIGDFYIEPDFKIKVKEVKILGIWFGGNCGNLKNWESLLERVKKNMDFWKTQSLTMEGKILIINQVILRMILYIAMIFLSPYLNNEINTLFQLLLGS